MFNSIFHLYGITNDKKSLKISKGKAESINLRRRDIENLTPAKVKDREISDTRFPCLALFAGV